MLVIDGLPPLNSIKDRYIQSVAPQSTILLREQVQRIEQGMGRGVRSNDDECCIVLMGDELTDVLSRNKGIDYFSAATRCQYDLSKQLLPRINNIQSVNITYPSVTDDVKEISSREDIELALKLTGFLKYDLFEKVNSEEEPTITITYFLKDGTSKTISANNTTVWWNNKIHVIKDKDMFINLTEGIFFLEDLQTK